MRITAKICDLFSTVQFFFFFFCFVFLKAFFETHLLCVLICIIMDSEVLPGPLAASQTAGYKVH